MYQPYPGGGADPMSPAPRPPIPPSVTNAVRLMYVGAGLTAIGLILEFIGLSALKSAIRTASPTLTNAQVNTAETVAVAFFVIIGLWIWMALASKGGHNYARIVSSVLFGLSTLVLLVNIARTGLAGGLIASLVTWLVGLGAIILLWRKESSLYFQPGVPR
jgi:lipopolysaccharide export LptBFGC system permease protein LptF